MFDIVLKLIDFVLGKSLNTAANLKKLKPTLRRKAAQALIGFYEDLEKLKINAEYVEAEIGAIIKFHQRNEYNSHTIENYLKAVTEAHGETLKILRHIFLVYNPRDFWGHGGAHPHNILTFLEIKEPELAQDVRYLMGIKYSNLMMLLTCFDLIHRKQADKSLQTIEYIASVNIHKLQKNSHLEYFDISLDELKKAEIIKTQKLRASNIDELILFNKGVRDFISKVDAVREKIRRFIADNFNIEEVF